MRGCWGQAGGRRGAASRSVIVRADGREQTVPSKMNIELGRHDRLRLWTTGGGYGDPLERAPERVQADVLDGKVSPEAAATVYGVVLRDGRLDEAATRDARRRLRAEAGAGTRPAGGDAPSR